MRKQKVLIVHNYYQVPGGEDTVVANEKALLEQNGHKVILYSRNNSELKNMNILQKLMLPVNIIFNFKRIILYNTIINLLVLSRFIFCANLTFLTFK